MAKNPLILDCPNGWQYFGGTHSCYKVMESVQSWNNAKRSCQDNKADLASKWKVEYGEDSTFAEENGLLFMETSAKTALSLFLAIAKKRP